MLATEKKVIINQKQWQDYSNLVDLLVHERDKINWDYIKSDSTKELFNYLDN